MHRKRQRITSLENFRRITSLNLGWGGAELADRAPLGTNKTDEKRKDNRYSHCFAASGVEDFGRKVAVIEKRSKACSSARKKREGWRGWEKSTSDSLPARAGPLSHGSGLALASGGWRSGESGSRWTLQIARISHVRKWCTFKQITRAIPFL